MIVFYVVNIIIALVYAIFNIICFYVPINIPEPFDLALRIGSTIYIFAYIITLMILLHKQQKKASNSSKFENTEDNSEGSNE